jgi:16S rRNA (guanine1516-N2)-methyltransferase
MVLPLTAGSFFAVPSNMSLNSGQLRLDFAGGAIGYRFRHGHGRGHPLAKAAGFKKDRVPSIVDATAGLGRDAFLLASVGANVVMLERSAEVHALLADALARASAASPDLAEVVSRMTLIHGDAKERLPKLRPDVVIVDPMHPPRQNSALVKQEMRLLSGIVGADEDAHELMQVALASARDRVVLKWPLRATPLLESPKPSHQFTGKTVRYEVFLTGRA